MSYCVNCGVELHPTSSVCPLCQTKVYNPNQPVATDIPTPYPSNRGESEKDTNLDFIILMTIVFLITSAVCALLNIFVFPFGKWSLYVMGICIMIWVFMLPSFFPNKMRVDVGLALDGIIISLYLGFISILHPGNGWYFHIAVPITILLTIFVEGFVWLAFKKHGSLLSRTIAVFADIGILCAALELLVRNHWNIPVLLTWSSIVLTCCVLIDIVLIFIMKKTNVRNELRRRMHF